MKWTIIALVGFAIALVGAAALKGGGELVVTGFKNSGTQLLKFLPNAIHETKCSYFLIFMVNLSINYNWDM